MSNFLYENAPSEEQINQFRYLQQKALACTTPNSRAVSRENPITSNQGVGSSNLSRRTKASIKLPTQDTPKKVTKVPKVVTKTDNFLSTQQVADREGVARKTVVEWCEKGIIPAVKTLKGTRPVYKIPENYKLHTPQDKVEWSAFKADWIQAQASGYLTGRHVGESGLHTNTYGIEMYFKMLGVEPDLDHVTPENLRLSLSNVTVDYKNKNCHYSQRMHMYTAFCSLYKFMILKGFRERADLIDISERRPKRIFPPKKTVLDEKSFESLLKFNKAHIHGRKEYDVHLTQLFLLLMGAAGLRRNEVVGLMLDHVDMQTGVIYVIDGKGHKNREVGILPQVADGLFDYLEKYRPRDSKHRELLLTNAGEPITDSSINKKILRLSRSANVTITPHGLRRTFATILENMGMPVSMIQMALGHTDIKTTQGYLMTDKRKMLDWMRAGK